jgi:hypothetical protein
MRRKVRQPLRHPVRHRQHTSAHHPQYARPFGLHRRRLDKLAARPLFSVQRDRPAPWRAVRARRSPMRSRTRRTAPGRTLAIVTVRLRSEARAVTAFVTDRYKPLACAHSTGLCVRYKRYEAGPRVGASLWRSGIGDLYTVRIKGDLDGKFGNSASSLLAPICRVHMPRRLHLYDDD